MTQQEGTQPITCSIRFIALVMTKCFTWPYLRMLSLLGPDEVHFRYYGASAEMIVNIRCFCFIASFDFFFNLFSRKFRKIRSIHVCLPFQKLGFFSFKFHFDISCDCKYRALLLTKAVHTVPGHFFIPIIQKYIEWWY